MFQHSALERLHGWCWWVGLYTSRAGSQLCQSTLLYPKLYILWCGLIESPDQMLVQIHWSVRHEGLLGWVDFVMRCLLHPGQELSLGFTLVRTLVVVGVFSGGLAKEVKC